MLGASFEETRGVVSIFFVAGTLTTALSLPRIVAVLIDSGQIGRLREGGDSIARALEEGLRYVTPIPATVRIADLDLRVRFARGERIHTENSYKFTPGMLSEILSQGGFVLEKSWADDKRWFGVHLARVKS